MIARFRRWLRYKLGLRLATIDFTDDQRQYWRIVIRKDDADLLLRCGDRWAYYGRFTDIEGPVWEPDDWTYPQSVDAPHEYIPLLRNAGIVKFLMAPLGPETHQRELRLRVVWSKSL